LRSVLARKKKRPTNPNMSVEQGKQWLEKILSLMKVQANIRTELSPISGARANEPWLVIEDSQLTPEQRQTLIGAKGESLDAMQYLMNTQINLGVHPDEQAAFTIELDGYRLKRQAELLSWTQSLVEQVRLQQKEVEMKDLSSAERRQVHSFLENTEDIKTESRGQEPDRRLIIRPR